ncbi:hypothetical protein ES711_01895 [Gelidibacter salicanalis]|uniref:Redoxin domain-containing protein n=1 Tax=Gelidibacter salicanalis TaxID=291193 RepID=A0A5C7ASV7_9FLAO|nr:hypothetical protein [Gelidibacter salicanalis]TXE10683.1 hypothetical protein ES711_01895 [Gelidibacter salicanalis]
MAIKKLRTLLLLLFCPLLFAQEKKVYFDDALAQHLSTFNTQSDLAIKNQQPEHVDVLFDTLVEKHLRNTYISDLKFRKTSGGKLYTETLDQPFLLITKNSAIIQKRAEIIKINEIASQYKDRLVVIVVYWDTKRTAKKKARRYNNNVIVVYADERHNKLNRTLSVYKHSFGVPTCFYINEDKQVYDIDRKFFLKNIDASTKKLFIERTQNSIAQLLETQPIHRSPQENSEVIVTDEP